MSVVSDAPTFLPWLDSLGALIGIGGAVALFNAYKAVEWKRAELASSFLKDFLTDPEIAFACRALDWYGGRLVVPECLRSLLDSTTNRIDHDFEIFRISMVPLVDYEAFVKEPRLQIYRTAMDTLFTRLSLISSAIDNRLFKPQDIDDIGYWIVRIHCVKFCEGFISEYGYSKSTEALRRQFAHSFEVYKSTALNRQCA